MNLASTMHDISDHMCVKFEFCELYWWQKQSSKICFKT